MFPQGLCGPDPLLSQPKGHCGRDEHRYVQSRRTLEKQVKIMQRIYFPLLMCFIVILAREENRVFSLEEKNGMKCK